MALVAIAVGALVYRAICVRSSDEFEARSQRLHDAIAAQLDGQLARAAQVARCTAAFVAANPDLTRDQIRRTLMAAVEQEPLIFGAAVAFEPHEFSPSVRLFAPYAVRRQGQIAFMDIGADSYDYTDPKWEWYRVPRESGVAAWTEPYFDQGAGDAMLCTFAVPIRRADRVIAVATVDVPVAELQSRLTTELRPLERLFVLSPRGTFVSAPDPALIHRRSLRSVAEERGQIELLRLDQLATAGRRGIVLSESISPGSRGFEPTWYFFGPVPTTGWSLLVAVPDRSLPSMEERDFQRSVPTLALGLLAVTGCVWVAARRYTRPIEDLTKAVRSMASGDFEQVVVPRVGSGDEVGQLAESVETTLAELRSRVPAMVRRQVDEELRTRVEETVELEVARRLAGEVRRSGRRAAIQEPGTDEPQASAVAEKDSSGSTAAVAAELGSTASTFQLRRGVETSLAEEQGVALDTVSRRDGVLMASVIDAGGPGLEAQGDVHAVRLLLRGLFGSTDDAGRLLREAARLSGGLRSRCSVGVVIYRPATGEAQVALAGAARAWLIREGEGAAAQLIGEAGAVFGGRTRDGTNAESGPADATNDRRPAQPPTTPGAGYQVHLEIGESLLLSATELDLTVRATARRSALPKGAWWLLRRTA